MDTLNLYDFLSLFTLAPSITIKPAQLIYWTTIWWLCSMVCTVRRHRPRKMKHGKTRRYEQRAVGVIKYFMLKNWHHKRFFTYMREALEESDPAFDCYKVVYVHYVEFKRGRSFCEWLAAVHGRPSTKKQTSTNSSWMTDDSVNFIV